MYARKLMNELRALYRRNGFVSRSGKVDNTTNLHQTSSKGNSRPSGNPENMKEKVKTIQLFTRKTGYTTASVWPHVMEASQISPLGPLAERAGRARRNALQAYSADVAASSCVLP